MFFDSVDTIPAKLFLKVQQSGDIGLLGQGDPKELLAAWDKIVEENEKLFGNARNVDRVFETTKSIESLSARHNCVINAVYYLRVFRDPELIALLKGYGYTITVSDSPGEYDEERYQHELDEIIRFSESINIKIARLEKQLPDPTEEETKKSSLAIFDQTVLAYASFLEMGFVDTNTITQSQYHAIIHNGDRKVKALKNGKAGKNNKRRGN